MFLQKPAASSRQAIAYAALRRPCSTAKHTLYLRCFAKWNKYFHVILEGRTQGEFKPAPLVCRLKCTIKQISRF